jgi:hypothetical protein
MESTTPLEMVMLLMLGEIRSCIFFSDECAAAAAMVEGELWRSWDKGGGAGRGKAEEPDAGRAFATQNGGELERRIFNCFVFFQLIFHRSYLTVTVVGFEHVEID